MISATSPASNGLRHGREAGDIGEEHGDLFVLPCGRLWFQRSQFLVQGGDGGINDGIAQNGTLGLQ